MGTRAGGNREASSSNFPGPLGGNTQKPLQIFLEPRAVYGTSIDLGNYGLRRPSVEIPTLGAGSLCRDARSLEVLQKIDVTLRPAQQPLEFRVAALERGHLRT